MKKSQNKKLIFAALSLMAFVGAYNAVMINSESTLSNNTDIKRLDDIFGEVKVGRSVAVTNSWKKISPVAEVAAPKSASPVSASVVPSEASIQDTLNLKLVEVVNAKKWSAGVTAAQFSGSIATNDGTIESLVATLPGNLNIDISFSEMTGNVFEYDLNGEIYSGIMYQVDQTAYMVTMTNGPLEGTRLRFAGENKDQNTYLAETHNVEVQTFGAQTEAPALDASETAAVVDTQSTSFKF